MDWIVVYQVTAFLAVALLAVIVTIFVLASSLLGLAVETASKEERDKRAEQDSRIAEQVEQARTEFEAAAEGTGEFERAAEILRTLKNEKREFEKETKRIHRSYEVFRPKGGVLYPGLPLLLSLILSTLAWGLSTGTCQLISHCLWGFSVAALGFSLHRIYFGLKRIESVAVTSEEVALARTTSALRVALEKHAEARKPQLKLVFGDKEPPFHCKKQSTLNIKYGIELVKGDIVQKAEIWFFAPPSFSFPGQDTWSQRARHEIPSARTCKVTSTDILPGISHIATIQLDTPPETGTFTLGYKLFYEGARGTVQEFQVVIE